MWNYRRLSCCALLLSLAVLGGCRSVLNLPPVQEIQGGFTVPVEVPGQPTAARVFADVGSFAQQRGFVRESAPATAQLDPNTHQPLPPAPVRYLRDKLKLDVVFDADHLRVTAYLHSAGGGGDRRFIGQFDRDFSQEYAGIYGGEGSISETNYADPANVPPRTTGGGRGGPRGGGH